MRKKLLATFRTAMAVMLLLFASNFAVLSTAFADAPTDIPQSGDIVWGQQGRDNATPNCTSGQTASFHYVLAPAGTDLTGAGSINVTFSTGSGTQAGSIHGDGSGYYDVTAPYNATATDATVTGATWTVNSNQQDKMPLLTLSHSECLGTPTTPQTIEVPAMPDVTDLCGPNNAAWVVPADTNQVTWTLTNGDLVANTTAGFVFTGNVTTHDFGQAPETNVDECSTTQTIEVPAMPDVTDLCGPNNAAWVVPADTNQVTWTLTNGDLVAHTTAGFVFTGNVTTHDFGQAPDSNKECKVFVCKYVGIPGINETLQTGNNPISVSINSIKDFNGIGSYFNDAQGRSFVLAFDDGTFHGQQGEPSAEDCPPASPTQVTPAVEFVNPTCENTSGRVTVTAVTGVTYKVNGSTVTGTTTYPAGSSVTVTAELATGFVLASGASSTFSNTFSDAPTDCVLGSTDVCPNIAGDQATVPDNFVKDQSGNCVQTGGMGGGSVLGVTTAAAPQQLVNTGQSTLTSVLIASLLAFVALGLAGLTRRQKA